MAWVVKLLGECLGTTNSSNDWCVGCAQGTLVLCLYGESALSQLGDGMFFSESII